MARRKRDLCWLGAIVAHPARLEALHLMIDADEPVSPKGLADKLRLPVPNVSYHVKILRQTGAIRLVRTEPRRGAIEHFYVPGKGIADMLNRVERALHA